MKWLYQPSDNFKSVFSYQRIESKYGRSVTYFVDGYDKKDRVTPEDADAVFNTDADLFSLNIDYDINENLSLKSISAYQRGERLRVNDADNTAMPVESGGGIVNRQSEDNNWSQEFRFNYEGDGVRGSSGVYLSGIEAKRNQANTINYNLPVLFDNFKPGLGAVLTSTAVLPVALYKQFFPTINSGKTNVDTSTWAVFLSGNLI